MKGVMDFHLASAAFADEVIPVEIQIAMKAVGFPTGTRHLFRGPAINEISKIIGE
jgi:hypothetical protein